MNNNLANNSQLNNGQTNATQSSKLQTIRLIIKILLILAAVAFIILGITQHGFRDVMNKAIRICYECIGIGLCS